MKSPWERLLLSCCNSAKAQESHLSANQPVPCSIWDDCLGAGGGLHTGGLPKALPAGDHELRRDLLAGLL